MKKFVEVIFAFISVAVKTFVFITVSVATVVADDISSVVVFMLASPLLIMTFIAGRSYIKSNGRKIASSVPLKDVSRQEYVASNFPVYGVCNMGTSLDEREIHRYEYSRMGLQPE